MTCSMVGWSLGTLFRGEWPNRATPSPPRLTGKCQGSMRGICPLSADLIDRMTAPQPQFLDVGSGAGSGTERRRVAYLKQPAALAGKPGLVWLCGLKSEMISTKASAVAEWAGAHGLGCLRFDYSGHGQS